MKDISVKTKMNLRKMNQLLVQYLEVANSIPEGDWKKIVLVSQRKKTHLKKILENTERGNLFMILFFVRELIETLMNSDGSGQTRLTYNDWIDESPSWQP